jgi:hypothetical protein
MTKAGMIWEEIIFQKIVLFEDMEYGQEGKHMGKRRLLRGLRYMGITGCIGLITDYLAIDWLNIEVNRRS